eukprot:TRINITY_DN6463_c0_g1_i3.p1 TRINITY_DN6463_c0_g1~~TRINITY_DN6463_c0_g1_i3.p1  ORF type:complete len:863 (+),score=180.36 TRINITY_DN6463_c0_g1_i3:572-3160(+)
MEPWVPFRPSDRSAPKHAAVWKGEVRSANTFESNLYKILDVIALHKRDEKEPDALAASLRQCEVHRKTPRAAAQPRTARSSSISEVRAVDGLCRHRQLLSGAMALIVGLLEKLGPEGAALAEGGEHTADWADRALNIGWRWAVIRRTSRKLEESMMEMHDVDAASAQPMQLQARLNSPVSDVPRRQSGGSSGSWSGRLGSSDPVGSPQSVPVAKLGAEVQRQMEQKIASTQRQLLDSDAKNRMAMRKQEIMLELIKYQGAAAGSFAHHAAQLVESWYSAAAPPGTDDEPIPAVPDALFRSDLPADVIGTAEQLQDALSALWENLMKVRDARPTVPSGFQPPHSLLPVDVSELCAAAATLGKGRRASHRKGSQGAMQRLGSRSEGVPRMGSRSEGISRLGSGGRGDALGGSFRMLEPGALQKLASHSALRRLSGVSVRTARSSEGSLQGVQTLQARRKSRQSVTLDTQGSPLGSPVLSVDRVDEQRRAVPALVSAPSLSASPKTVKSQQSAPASPASPSVNDAGGVPGGDDAEGTLPELLPLPAVSSKGRFGRQESALMGRRVESTVVKRHTGGRRATIQSVEADDDDLNVRVVTASSAVVTPPAVQLPAQTTLGDVLVSAHGAVPEISAETIDVTPPASPRDAFGRQESRNGDVPAARRSFAHSVVSGSRSARAIRRGSGVRSGQQSVTKGHGLRTKSVSVQSVQAAAPEVRSKSVRLTHNLSKGLQDMLERTEAKKAAWEARRLSTMNALRQQSEQRFLGGPDVPGAASPPPDPTAPSPAARGARQSLSDAPVEESSMRRRSRAVSIRPGSVAPLAYSQTREVHAESPQLHLPAVGGGLMDIESQRLSRARSSSTVRNFHH